MSTTAETLPASSSVDQLADNRLAEEETASVVSDDDDEDWETCRKLKDPPSFTFYEYGFHGVSESLHQFASTFQHLRENLSSGLHRMHESYQALSKDYQQSRDARQRSRSPSPKRVQENMFNIKEFQRTQEKTKQKSKMTISRFRPDEPRWDGSFSITRDLENQLYRIPCRDPSGKVIFSLQRDEAKGAKAWKTPQPDQDIPEPAFTSCSSSYQRLVLQYMDEVIEKVEAEYKSMPENTQEKSTLKAKVGADLNNFRMKREKLRRDIEEQEQREQAARHKYV